jgi:cysteine desulfurase
VLIFGKKFHVFFFGNSNPLPFKKMIYLDNNATTRIAPEVTAAMQSFLHDSYGNPSSSHRAGRAAREAIERAREQVAAALGAFVPDEIVFTSCGTESNNWALFSALELQPAKNHIVTTRVEHESVARPLEKLAKRGYEITFLDVDERGLLDLEAVRAAVSEKTALVSVMLANNETGVVFPVADIARIVKEKSADALVHVDGVQAVGKIPLDLKNTEIDLFAISGHKFHAPKGVGALYIKQRINLPAFLVGGGQESGRRAGTESLSQIVALGAAGALAQNFEWRERIKDLRDRLENEILEKIPFARLNGTAEAEFRLPNTANISFEGIEGESILAHLDERGICVSTGSACNSETHTASPVLQAMNVPYRTAMGAIRFSLSRYTTTEEIEKTLQVLPKIIEKLRDASPFHS